MASEGRKLIVSLKDAQRPIIMTDTNPTDSIEDLESKLIKLMGSKRICAIKTQDDLLIVRPSQVSTIMVSSKGEFEQSTTIDETDFLEDLDDESDEKGSDYVESLTFEETEDESD